MKFDDILHELGDFGTYQRRIYAMLCVCILPSSWLTLLQVFAMLPANHWCKIPTWNSTACTELGYDQASCDVMKISLHIPLVVPHNTSDDGVNPVYETCFRYNLSVDLAYANITSREGMMSRDVIPCDSGWEHDRSIYRTVIQEHDLVCGRERYVQLPQVIYFAGYLAGSVVFGTLADRYGRYPSFAATLVLGILLGYAPLAFHSYWAYALLRFFQGAVNISYFIIIYIMATEIVGTSRRTFAGFGIMMADSVGYMLMAGIAYLCRDWRTLLIATTSLRFLTFPFLLFIPESPRWLIKQGQHEKAKTIILKAAKVNKSVLPDGLLEDVLQASKVTDGESKVKYSPLELFRHPNMRTRTIILMYIWSACAVVYHGLNLSASSLGINVFVSFLVSGATEIPALLVCIFLVEYPGIGRRWVSMTTLLLGGIACLLTVVSGAGPVMATLGMVGKFGVTAAFSTSSLHTLELYPTLLRGIGLGTCSTASRCANIMAPLILLTGQYWGPAPLVIFGTGTLIAGLFVIPLPETQGRKLPETVQEGEDFKRMKRGRSDIATGRDGQKVQEVELRMLNDITSGDTDEQRV